MIPAFVFFTFLAVGFILSSAGINILIMIVTIELNLISKLFFILIGFIFIFSGLFVIKFTMYISLTGIEEERNIIEEKTVLKIIVILCWLMVLFGVSIFLFLFANYFLSLYPVSQPYMLVIVSAAIGAFWGVGMNEAARFWNWIEYGKDFEKNFDMTKKGLDDDWYSPESFVKNLQFWKIRLLLAFGFLSIIAFVLLPKVEIFI